MSVSRRDFLQLAATAAVGATTFRVARAAAQEGVSRHSADAPTFEFVPRLGQFVHHAPNGFADEARFLAAQGFVSVDDPSFQRRTADERRCLADVTSRFGLRLNVCEGVVELRGPTFASRSASDRAAARAEVDRAVQAVADAGGRFCTLIPGRLDASSSLSTQWRRAVDTLRKAADVAAARQVTLLIEPLDADHTARRHGTPMLVPTLERAAELCRDVGSPYCQAMVDVYRWSTIRGGVRPLAELLPTLESEWDLWGAIRIADAPGGQEPGTGGLNFRGLFAFLAARGFAGPVAMSHGASLPELDGERAVLKAYADLRAS